jgi:hypothetical protein
MTLKLTWTPHPRDPRCYRAGIGSLRLAAYGHGWDIASPSTHRVLKSGDAKAAWRDNAEAAEQAFIELFPDWIEGQQRQIDVATSEFRAAFPAA